MKMLKYVVMVDNDVKMDTVFVESERVFVRELNEKYGKENVLKVIDITNKDVLEGMSKKEFIEKLSDYIRDIEFLSTAGAEFIIQATTKALND